MTLKETLRQEIEHLDEEELLALCYSFHTSQERLKLYLDILRKRPGQRAQFASCLLCFDLARQGHEKCQQEFPLLAETLLVLSRDTFLVQKLLGEDPYLKLIWDFCQEALRDSHELWSTPSLADVLSQDRVSFYPLLCDADVPDLNVQLEPDMLHQQLMTAVTLFLGGAEDMPVYDASGGFRLRNKSDIERIERFLQTLQSLRDVVPLAHGFLAITLLFYGHRMRSHYFFKSENLRKQQLLREGLAQWLEHPEEVLQVVGVLGALHADLQVWPEIMQSLLQYSRWLFSEPFSAKKGLQAYEPLQGRSMPSS